MKINIFFFSKWKWKADALIQTLYKRTPGWDKRKEIPLPGVPASTWRPLPATAATSGTIFSHPNLLSLRLSTDSPNHPRRGPARRNKNANGTGDRGAKEKFTVVLFYISALPPPALPSSIADGSPSAHQSAIHRTTWQSTDIKKNKRKWRVRNGREDGAVRGWLGVAAGSKGHRRCRRPGDEKKKMVITRPEKRGKGCVTKGYRVLFIRLAKLPPTVCLAAFLSAVKFSCVMMVFLGVRFLHSKTVRGDISI